MMLERDKCSGLPYSDFVRDFDSITRSWARAPSNSMLFSSSWNFFFNIFFFNLKKFLAEKLEKITWNFKSSMSSFDLSSCLNREYLEFTICSSFCCKT